MVGFEIGEEGWSLLVPQQVRNTFPKMYQVPRANASKGATGLLSPMCRSWIPLPRKALGKSSRS